MKNFIKKYWTAQNHELPSEKIKMKESSGLLSIPREKVYFLDFLYFCFLTLLILDRTSILPTAGIFQIFPYQLVEAVLIFFMFVCYKKIYVPNRILFAYLPIFIQSGLIILLGTVEKSVIIKENIQLMLLVILSILVYNSDSEQLKRRGGIEYIKQMFRFQKNLGIKDLLRIWSFFEIL